MRWFHKYPVKVGQVSSKNMVLQDKWVKCIESIEKSLVFFVQNGGFECGRENRPTHREIHEWSGRLGGELFGGLGVAR